MHANVLSYCACFHKIHVSTCRLKSPFSFARLRGGAQPKCGYNLITDMTNLENKFRTTWNQKLVRVTGHDKSPEEGLEKLGKVGV